jgi:hypothetical protein
MRDKLSMMVLALADRKPLQYFRPYQSLENGGMDWSVIRCHSYGCSEFD